ncbi:1706_t:CDS:2, partial [Gigaspora margarita]
NDNENWLDDSETDSELKSNHNSNEAGPSSKSSKSLSSQLKDNKKTASLPKKKKKQENVEILRFNELSNLNMDQEIGLAEKEEVDKLTIKILYNRSEANSRYLNNELREANENEDKFYSQLDLACDACLYALSSSPNLDLIEKEFKNAIFNSLKKNWYDFHEIRLVATLLDPRTKKMILFTSRKREKARIKLKNEFEKLQ